MDTDYKSRTRRKNEDQALQRLGEQLVVLPFRQLETMGLPDELLTAIEFARKIRSHGARRRQIRHIGALCGISTRNPSKPPSIASGRETYGNNLAPAKTALLPPKRPLLTQYQLNL
jgi:ribosome-associated protein